MTLRATAYGGIAFVAGAALGALVARRSGPPNGETPAPSASAGDETDLAQANSNLARELQTCNRRVVRMARGVAASDPAYGESYGEQTVEMDAGVAALDYVLEGGGLPPSDAGAADPDAGTVVRIDLPFAELTADEWARQAERAAVPYRIPCLRDNPWRPPPRELDKIGLAPQDGDAIREAYSASNQRVLAGVRPLCASVLGSQPLVDRLGASACLKAVIDATRRDDPKAMRAALARVAEVNAGKRAPPSGGGATPLEALLYDLTNEAKTFAADLVGRIGPEDAQRVLSAKWLCRDGGTVNADTGGPKRPAGR
jgi:hypothetical protein